MLEQLFNSPFIYSLSLTLVHFLWQGLLVALILKSALSIIDKKKSKLRYGLATFAMLANAILAILTFAMLYPDTSYGINNTLSPIPLTSLINELTHQNTLLSYPELLPSILAYSLPYFSLMWLASIVALTIKLLLEVRNVNNLPRHSCVSPSPALVQRFDELARQIKLTTPPKLLISLKAQVPMAIGWLKPVVLLPASMVSGLDSTQLEMLILHELAHIRRHDYLINFLQTLIELLFFFHPSVHWIGKQMRHEREYCSDDIAVQHCGNAIAYAHTLTDTASLCAKGHFHTIPTMAMAASGGDLKARVVRLVDHHCAPTSTPSKWLAAISLLLALTLLSVNQLLTMPFALQLNNQLPWQDNSFSGHTIFRTSTPSINVKVDNSSTLSSNSIAKQLLSNETNADNTSSINTGNKKLASEILVDIKPLHSTAIAEQSTTNNVKTEKKSLAIVSPKIKPTTVANNNVIESKQARPHKQKRLGQTLTTSPLATKETLQVKQSTQLAELQPELAEVKPYQKANLQLPSQFSRNLSSKEASSRQLSYQNELNNLSTDNTLYHASPNLSYKDQKTPRSLEAKLLKSVNPVYPGLAKRRGIEMEVKVDFTIDQNGKVKDINFAQQSKLIYFKSAIRSAISKWRFSPAIKSSRIVESKMSKIFSFSLKA